MSYYKVCSLCGAALDPGERCDCADEQEKLDAAANDKELTQADVA